MTCQKHYRLIDHSFESGQVVEFDSYKEYFEEVRDHLPFAARMGLELTQPNTVLGKAVAYNARTKNA